MSTAREVSRRDFLGGAAAVAAGAPLAAAGEAGGIEKYAALVSADPDLLAWWRLEGDLRDSKGALHAEARGGDPAFADGPGGGKCLALEKGRWLTAGPAPGLERDALSVELWFRPRFER